MSRIWVNFHICSVDTASINLCCIFPKKTHGFFCSEFFMYLHFWCQLLILSKRLRLNSPESGADAWSGFDCIVFPMLDCKQQSLKALSTTWPFQHLFSSLPHFTLLTIFSLLSLIKKTDLRDKDAASAAPEHKLSLHHSKQRNWKNKRKTRDCYNYSTLALQNAACALPPLTVKESILYFFKKSINKRMFLV